MKNIIITLFLMLFTTEAFAQSATAIIGTNGVDPSLQKLDVIKDRAESDLTIVKQKTGQWEEDFKTTVSTIDNNIEQLNVVINDLKSRMENPMQSENDNAGAKSHSKANDPRCSNGSNPRAVFINGRWRCEPRFTCSVIDENLDDWNADPSGKCIRPKTVWEVSAWTPNIPLGQETRSVVCKYQGRVLNDDACSKPKPAAIRSYAVAGISGGGDGCTIGATQIREFVPSCSVNQQACNLGRKEYRCTVSGWVETRIIFPGSCSPVAQMCI